MGSVIIAPKPIIMSKFAQTNPLGVNDPPMAFDFNTDGKSINLSGFTNIEKGYISENVFLGEYGDPKVHEVTTRAQLLKRQENLADQVQKGETTWEEHKDVFKGYNRCVVLLNSGKLSEVFVKSIQPTKDDLEKGGDGEGDTITKSLIDGYREKITFNKTGKEIKEKLQGIKTDIGTKIAEHAAKAENLKITIGFEPEETVSQWRSNCDKVDATMHKVYPYEKCQSAPSYEDSDSSSNCRQYNDCVYKLIDLKCDMVEADFYINNLEDKKSYNLSAREAMKLGF